MDVVSADLPGDRRRGGTLDRPEEAAPVARDHVLLEQLIEVQADRRADLRFGE